MTEENDRRNDKSRTREKENDEDGSIFDRVRADGLKSKLESLLRDGKIRNFMGELRLPREIITHIISQVDETKQAALGVVSREMRLFLERTNLADELAKLLTQVSFEVKTQVRFVPSDKALKAKVKSTTTTSITEEEKSTKDRPSPDSPEGN
jgi:histidinol dehydrogenase